MKNLQRQTAHGNRAYRYLPILTVLFSAALISSNVIAVKLIAIFGVIVPAGIIVFPINYIINDVMTEVYGLARTKQVILLGFVANLMFVVFVGLAGALPAAPFWHANDAYQTILGYTPRLLAASFIAYLAGSFSNAYAMVIIKALTKGKYLWIRTIGSTIIGEGIDSLLFIALAFWGFVPSASLTNMILIQWTMKVAYEVFATPVTYSAVAILRRAENIDK